MRLVEALGSAFARSGCDRRSDAEKAKAFTVWVESHPELAGLDPVGLSPDQWDVVVGPPVVPTGRGWSGRADQLRELVAAQPEVEGVTDVKAVMLGAGAIRFKAEVDFDGVALSRMELDKMDLAAIHSELNSPEELGAFLERFGNTMVEAVGDAVDRIEQKALEAVPELAHVDLEAD